MNIGHLRTFYVLAKTGSFSRAAEELHITQPGVSIHIKSLEDYLGIGLFEKVDKKFVLTEAGKVFYLYVVKIFNLIDETKRSLSCFTNLKCGSLSLGATSNIGVYILPCLLGEFKRKHPEINIQVSIGNTRIIEQKILSNEIDLGLVEAKIHSLSEVTIKHWRDEKLILITSPKHPWAKLKHIKPSRLVDQSFVVGERGSGTRRVLAEKLPSIVNNLKVFLELGSTEAVKRAVEVNLGVSFVGESTVNRELKNGTLKTIRIDGTELSKKLNIIYLKGKYITPVMKEFTSFIYNDCRC